MVLSAQRNDAGAYTCEAKNPAGKATKEFLLKVNGMLLFHSIDWQLITEKTEKKHEVADLE